VQWWHLFWLFLRILGQVVADLFAVAGLFAVAVDCLSLTVAVDLIAYC